MAITTRRSIGTARIGNSVARSGPSRSSVAVSDQAAPWTSRLSANNRRSVSERRAKSLFGRGKTQGAGRSEDVSSYRPTYRAGRIVPSCMFQTYAWSAKLILTKPLPKALCIYGQSYTFGGFKSIGRPLTDGGFFWVRSMRRRGLVGVTCIWLPLTQRPCSRAVATRTSCGSLTARGGCSISTHCGVNSPAAWRPVACIRRSPWSCYGTARSA